MSGRDAANLQSVEYVVCSGLMKVEDLRIGSITNFVVVFCCHSNPTTKIAIANDITVTNYKHNLM